MKIIQNRISQNGHDVIVAAIDMQHLTIPSVSRRDTKMDYFSVEAYPSLADGDDEQWDVTTLAANTFFETLSDSDCISLGTFYNNARRVLDEAPTEYRSILIAQLVDTLEQELSLVSKIESYVNSGAQITIGGADLLHLTSRSIKAVQKQELTDLTVLGILSKVMFPVWGELLPPYEEQEHSSSERYTQCLETINVGGVKRVLDQLHGHVVECVERNMMGTSRLIRNATSAIMQARMVTSRYVSLELIPELVVETDSVLESDLPLVTANVAASFSRVHAAYLN